MQLLTSFIRLSKCPYIGCMKKYPDFMRLRHLVWRFVPIECAPCSAIKDNTKKKVLLDMLGVAKLFPYVLPNGSPTNEDHVVTWLLSNPVLLDKLSQVAGFITPAHSHRESVLA